MEVESPMLALREAITPASESLRQRQLDRLTPRGRLWKDDAVDSSIREAQEPASAATGVALTPGTKVSGLLSPESGSKRRRHDDVRPENHGNPRGKGAGTERRIDITPDGGSAGREGRQFTVANVGNNGRIYLR
jgi:hypothetical protein